MKAALLSVLLLLVATRVAAAGGEVREAGAAALKESFPYAPAAPAAAAPTARPDATPDVVKMAQVIVLAPRVGRALEQSLDDQVRRQAAAAAADWGNLHLAKTQIGNTTIELGLWWNPVDEHRGLLRTRNLGIKAELLRIQW